MWSWQRRQKKQQIYFYDSGELKTRLTLISVVGLMLYGTIQIMSVNNLNCISFYDKIYKVITVCVITESDEFAQTLAQFLTAGPL